MSYELLNNNLIDAKQNLEAVIDEINSIEDMIERNGNLYSVNKKRLMELHSKAGRYRKFIKKLEYQKSLKDNA